MLLFQAELWFAWWIFLRPSLAVTCCQLPFPSPGITLAQANSCPPEFIVISDFMLSMSIYSFFSRTLFDPFFFSSAPLHPGTPLHSSFCTGRILLLKILMNSLSLNKRDLLLTDIWHRVISRNSGESDSLLLWHAGTAWCLRETDVPALLPLHTALPFPPSSPALLLPWLQTRQNIR